MYDPIYYQANKEKYKKARDKYRTREITHQAYLKSKEKKTRKKPAKIHELWIQAKHRAVRNNLEFTILESDIVIPELCPILQKPMVSPSLDRLDNSKGYTKENIRVVSKEGNRKKSDLTLEEVILIYYYMSEGERSEFPSRIRRSSRS